jgi:uncharacterized membrane-anchored protein YitT (DUF2179 family)
MSLLILSTTHQKIPSHGPKKTPDHLNKMSNWQAVFPSHIGIFSPAISVDTQRPEVVVLSTRLVTGIDQVIMACLIGLVLVVVVNLPTMRFLAIFLGLVFFILYVWLNTRVEIGGVWIAGAT